MNAKIVAILAVFLGFSCSTPTDSDKKEINQTQYWNYLANLEFPESYPTPEATEDLYNEMLFQRATQAVLWSMPAMTLWYMKQGSEAQFGAGSNVLPIWKNR